MFPTSEEMKCDLITTGFLELSYEESLLFQRKTSAPIRRMAENGFAPPLGNFADISYLVEN